MLHLGGATLWVVSSSRSLPISVAWFCESTLFGSKARAAAPVAVLAIVAIIVMAAAMVAVAMVAAAMITVAMAEQQQQQQ